MTRFPRNYQRHGDLAASSRRPPVDPETLIQEAIEFHLEGIREMGLPIPVPASFAGAVEIRPAA